MANPPPARASFSTQANALLRKNLTFQKRNVKTNIRLIIFPLILCVLLVVLQRLIDRQFDKPQYKCGCVCPNGKANCPSSEKLCGAQYSDADQFVFCPIPNPPEWPPLLQLPSLCRTGSDALTFLFTADNRSFAQSVSGNMFPSDFTVNESDIMASLATNVMGSEESPDSTNFFDSAFSSGLPIYYLLSQCSQDIGFSFPFQLAGVTVQQEFKCGQGLNLWRDSSSEINNELYKGYKRGNPERNINGIVSAIDFLNSNGNRFNVTVWYNSSYKSDTGFGRIDLMRIPRSVNLISNAYLQFLLGPSANILFEFVKEMPKAETPLRLEIASLLGGLFFTWVVLQLFPVSVEYQNKCNGYEFSCV